jgi:hypothetical protein
MQAGFVTVVTAEETVSESAVARVAAQAPVAASQEPMQQASICTLAVPAVFWASKTTAGAPRAVTLSVEAPVAVWAVGVKRPVGQVRFAAQAGVTTRATSMSTVRAIYLSFSSTISGGTGSSSPRTRKKPQDAPSQW